MAASLLQPNELVAVELRQLRGSDLENLLAEQAALWSDELQWDFGSSKETLLRFIDGKNLQGFALLRRGLPIGYSYFIHDDHKAMVGDLFITRSERHQQTETMLLLRTLRAAAVYPGVRRIEGQLLTLAGDLPAEAVYGEKLQRFERVLMLADASPPRDVPPGARSFDFRTWTHQDLDRTADLIYFAYQGHVDSLLNDQYRSLAGARRFLFNSTQHPGCGAFFPAGARAATDPLTGEMAGVCLGSQVKEKVGHITQLCVAPRYQRQGAGRDLLRQSLNACWRHGCEAVSLTVTCSNRAAVELYESVGFRVHRQFLAFVWEIC
jgi:ribosomal protein S18 acetylase RimI-like enzyme